MVQPVRIKDFTRRQVRERERLFNPETPDWPEPRDSNLDYFMAVLTGFFVTIGLGCLAIFAYVLYLVVTWP